jgi:hypothetical protein
MILATITYLALPTLVGFEVLTAVIVKGCYPVHLCKILGSRSGGYEVFYLLGYNALQSG